MEFKLAMDECSFQTMSAHTAPPPQYFIPVPVKATPIKMTVIEVTTGGKIPFKMRRGKKAKINLGRKEKQQQVEHVSTISNTILISTQGVQTYSRRPHTMEVPNMFP